MVHVPPQRRGSARGVVQSDYVVVADVCVVAVALANSLTQLLFLLFLLTARAPDSVPGTGCRDVLVVLLTGLSN